MEPVIDLDLYGDTGSDGGGSGEFLPASPIWRDLRTVLAAVGTVLILLLGGAGIAPTPLYSSSGIDVGDNSGFQLADGHVYVIGPGGSGVTAYGMDGTRLWTAGSKATMADSIVADGGTVLIGDEGAVPDQESPQAQDSTDQSGSSARLPGSVATDRTVAYDARTGQRRWAGQGRAFTATAGPSGGAAALVIEQSDVGRTKLINPPSTLIGRSLVTGAPLWSYQIGSQAMISAAQLVRVESPTLLTVTGAILYSGLEGDVQIDFTSGRRSTVVGIPASAVGNFIIRIGDILLTVTTLTADRSSEVKVVGPFGGDRWILSAYDATTQEARWQTTVDVGLFSFSQCGKSICAASGTRVRALDPATGAIRWEAPWAYIIGDDAYTPGRAVGVAGVTAGTPNVAVLDSATGKTMTSIGPWQPLRWVQAEWMPLVRTDAAGRVELAALDVNGLRAYRLGNFDGSASRCQADRTYIVCAVSGEQIKVWKYSR